MPEIMNKELTEQLLSLYIDKSQPVSMRDPMPVDWNDKKWCAATQGNHFIMIPANAENKVVEPDHRTVNIAAIIQPFNANIRISISALQVLYDSIPIIDQDIMEECEACDGETKFEHYGKWYKCKSCDFFGKVKTGSERVKDPGTCIKINQAIFSNRFIGTLLQVIKITNCQRLELRYSKEFGLNVFELGNQILIGIGSVYDLENNDHVITLEISEAAI